MSIPHRHELTKTLLSTKSSVFLILSNIFRNALSILPTFHTFFVPSNFFYDYFFQLALETNKNYCAILFRESAISTVLSATKILRVSLLLLIASNFQCPLTWFILHVIFGTLGILNCMFLFYFYCFYIKLLVFFLLPAFLGPCKRHFSLLCQKPFVSQRSRYIWLSSL